MDKKLEAYLSSVEKKLSPLPASERIDIVKEIKSSIIELEQTHGLAPEEIIERLGEPAALSRAYLGDLISSSKPFSIKKFSALIAFYSIAGLTGMFVLPCVSVLSVGLMVCAPIAAVAGIVKSVGFLFGFDVPFVSFQFGSFALHPLLVGPASVLAGALLFIAGRALWKLLLRYIRTVSKQKQQLSAK